MIDIADYELSRQMFGMEVSMGASVQVPEPSGWMLGHIGSLGFA